MNASSDSEPIGLIAGWGRYPHSIIEALHRQGRRVVGVGIYDHTDPELAKA